MHISNNRKYKKAPAGLLCFHYRAAAVNEFLSNKCFKALSLFVFKRISAVNVRNTAQTSSPTLISCRTEHFSIEKLPTSFISDNLSSAERGTQSTGTLLY